MVTSWSASGVSDRPGHEIADRIDREIIGRNVLEGRWTFQLVEEYDATYWEPVRATKQSIERRLVAGREHVYESEMKEHRRTHGRRHHEQRPDAGA